MLDLPVWRGLKTILGYKTELKFLLKPIVCITDVTLKCNLKCPMCPIWKLHPKNELELPEIKSAFSSKMMKNIVVLALTGGEPFLRKDFPEIVFAAEDLLPSLRELRIATNGVLTDRIISMVSKMPKREKLMLSIKVSLDGLGSTNDKMRGVPGSFSKTTRTLQELQKLKNEGHNISTSVGFTVTDENVKELEEMYKMFGKEFEFFFKPCLIFPEGNEDLYPKSTPLSISESTRRYLISFLNSYLKEEFSKKRSLRETIRKFFYQYQLDFLENPDKVPFFCTAGFSEVFIDHCGGVYPCAVSGSNMKAVGNIREESLDNIWYSSRMLEIRKWIKKGRCRCLTSCDVYSSLVISKGIRIGIDYIMNAMGKNKRETTDL